MAHARPRPPCPVRRATACQLRRHCRIEAQERLRRRRPAEEPLPPQQRQRFAGADTVGHPTDQLPARLGGRDDAAPGGQGQAGHAIDRHPQPLPEPHAGKAVREGRPVAMPALEALPLRIPAMHRDHARRRAAEHHLDRPGRRRCHEIPGWEQRRAGRLGMRRRPGDGREQSKGDHHTSADQRRSPRWAPGRPHGGAIRRGALHPPPWLRAHLVVAPSLRERTPRLAASSSHPTPRDPVARSMRARSAGDRHRRRRRPDSIAGCAAPPWLRRRRR